MTKALLRKQFRELFAFYFTDRKTGELRTKKKAALFGFLYALLLVYVGVAVFLMTNSIAGALVPAGYGWFYFAITGLLAIVIGIFGAVFNTYASLYNAKDNDLLLSMPIPPSRILVSRLVGVYAMGLLFVAVVFIPACIAYWLHSPVKVSGLLFCILLVFILGLLVLTLTCALGWVVAQIAGRLKHRSLVTVLLTFLFLAVYFWGYSKLLNSIGTLMEKIDTFSASFRDAAYPIYMMGKAAEGEAVPFVLFTLIVLALFALAFYILSSTFIKTATRSEKTVGKVYVEREAKVTGAERALLRKEFKRLTSSPTYLMNSSIGSVMMVVAAAAIVIMGGRIKEILAVLPLPEGVVGMFLPAVLCLFTSTNTLTAPSVSLEGNNIWIAQSLPVPASSVLRAKQYLHVLVTAPPLLLLNICFCAAFGVNALTAVLGCVLALLLSVLFADFGLFLNLKRPNLQWTNEVVPVKQSIAVAIVIFGGWALAVLMAVGGWFLSRYLGSQVYAVLWLVLASLGVRVLEKWTYTKGSIIFSTL